MKKIFLFLILNILCCIAINAQIQQGRVKTRGRLNPDGTVRAGQGIVGASMTFGNGSTAVSGNNGIFSFATKEGGFTLKSVQKKGFQLCDRDLLGRNKRYSINTFEIAMQTPDEALEDRLESEEKIRATLTAQLNKQKTELKRLKEDLKISQQDYNSKLQELYSVQSENEKLISEMAERYSSIDFDQMDDFQRRVAAFIQNGELTRADSLLNTKGSMEERSAELDRLHSANVEKREMLEKSENMEAKLLEDFATDCYSRFEICKLKHQNDSAAYWIELRVSKDTTNVEWLLDVGLFFETYFCDYNYSLNYYKKALNNAIEQYGQHCSAVSTCLNNIGHVLSIIGKYDLAIEYAIKACEIDSVLEEQFGVVVALHNLGNYYLLKSDYATALDYYRKSLNSLNKLHATKEPEEANIYNSLGSLYSETREDSLALDYFFKSLTIYKELFGEKNMNVARSYGNIGIVYACQNKYDLALDYSCKALNIDIELLGENHLDVAVGYNNIGDDYRLLGDYDLALEYLYKALNIVKEMLGEEHITTGTVYSNIGKVYLSQGDSYSALDFFKKDLDICENVFGETHVSVVKPLEQLGYAYLVQGDFIHALNCQQRALSVLKQTDEDKSYQIHNLYTNIMYLYDVARESGIELPNYSDFVSHIVFTATTLDGDSPAKQQCIDGEYIVLAFEDWTISSRTSLIKKNQEFVGKPKNLVLMKDCIITQHYFENSIGVKFGYKYVGEEEKLRITQQYHNWKNKK